MNTYAAQVDDTGTVVQVIVGTADWATTRLGGVWLDTDTLVGIGWQVVDGTITPPEPDEHEDALDEPEFM
jgi:hypothetical protein